MYSGYAYSVGLRYLDWLFVVQQVVRLALRLAVGFRFVVDLSYSNESK